MKFFDFSEHKGDVIGPWKTRNHSSPGYHTTDGLSHQLKWLLQARRKNPRPRSRASTKSGNPILTPHPAGVDAPDRAAMLGSIGWWHSCNNGGGKATDTRQQPCMQDAADQLRCSDSVAGAQRKLIPHTYLIQSTIPSWQPRARQHGLCELVGMFGKGFVAFLTVVRRRRSLVAVDWRHAPLCPPCMRRRA